LALSPKLQESDYSRGKNEADRKSGAVYAARASTNLRVSPAKIGRIKAHAAASTKCGVRVKAWRKCYFQMIEVLTPFSTEFYPQHNPIDRQCTETCEFCR
jgi:hypothetical protein